MNDPRLIELLKSLDMRAWTEAADANIKRAIGREERSAEHARSELADYIDRTGHDPRERARR